MLVGLARALQSFSGCLPVRVFKLWLCAFIKAVKHIIPYILSPQHFVIAERLSAGQLILQCSGRIWASVCIYLSVTLSAPGATPGGIGTCWAGASLIALSPRRPDGWWMWKSSGDCEAEWERGDTETVQVTMWDLLEGRLIPRVSAQGLICACVYLVRTITTLMWCSCY